MQLQFLIPMTPTSPLILGQVQVLGQNTPTQQRFLLAMGVA
jgi:hypothetical protein